MPESHSSKLTPEFCRQNNVMFRPKTIDEAIFIQQRLADFGIGWVTGDSIGANASECVNYGMVVQEGKLYHSPNSNARNILCSPEQFDAHYLPPEQKFFLEHFNRLAERIDALATRLESLEHKVDVMHEALFPKIENIKPALKRVP
jgi:hypothetical protein